ncbi:MAG: hypothetical protein IJD92_05280 [Bacilli bacterium]|nr:hypothetical protein [Bacilli bacterium]
MTLNNAKQEIINRYKYIYENADLILAPYMCEETPEEFKISKEKYGYDKPLINLKINYQDNINKLFEEFLLSEKPFKETELYKYIERKRFDRKYLEKVKKGIELVQKANEGKNPIMHIKLNFWGVLGSVERYIDEQSGDLNNKNNKIKVLDEYFRLGRYKNNGKIYTSGVKLDLHDCDSLIIPKKTKEPKRDKNDVGIKKNAFINVIANAPRYEYNSSIFTEREKQEIYLEYHDELPHDLEINCAIEEEYIKTMIETRLKRPENTKPCGDNFIIRENEIFVNPDDKLYRYYQICPNCGFIVNIPKEILSYGLKKRIEDRCNKDDKLFRKMYLYSELFSLDKNSTKDQKKLLKK